MAINRTVEDSFAAASESSLGQLSAGGNFATLTLESHSIEVESADISLSESNIERNAYPRAAMGDLPTVRGGRNATASVVVPLRFDGAGTIAEVDPLLKACGLAESGDVYTPTSTVTTCALEMTEGTQWKQAIGCAGNFTLEANPGDIARLSFEMQGHGFYMEEDAISGSTYTVDSIAPVVFDKSLVLLTGASNSAADFTTPYVTSVSFDLGNDVQPRTTGAMLALPNYAVEADDGGVITSFLTESNEATADDVEPFPATPAADDAFYVGSRHPFCGLKFQITTSGDTSMTVVWEYYNGSSWVTLNHGVQEVVDFDEAAGTYHNTFGPPSDWAKTAVDGQTLYWVRARVSAFTSSSTQALVGQVWTLYESGNNAGYYVAQRAPRLTLVMEMEDDAVYDPTREWLRGVTRDIDLTFGTANNNTVQLALENAWLAQAPTITRDGGLVRYQCVYGVDNTAATPFSITFT